MGGVPAKTPKMVFLYPLQRDWRTILLEGAERAGEGGR